MKFVLAKLVVLVVLAEMADGASPMWRSGRKADAVKYSGPLGRPKCRDVCTALRAKTCGAGFEAKSKAHCVGLRRTRDPAGGWQFVSASIPADAFRALPLDRRAKEFVSADQVMCCEVGVGGTEKDVGQNITKPVSSLGKAKTVNVKQNAKRGKAAELEPIEEEVEAEVEDGPVEEPEEQEEGQLDAKGEPVVDEASVGLAGGIKRAVTRTGRRVLSTLTFGYFGREKPKENAEAKEAEDVEEDEAEEEEEEEEQPRTRTQKGVHWLVTK